MASPVKPKPAASLVITRQKKKNLYVLMGQRPKNSKFAPNVWVFPGGKVEKYDSLNKDIKLNKKILTDLKKLKANNLLSSALISAALRETYEETGLKLINKNLEGLWVLARAITPANQKIRFDTKFFVLDENNFTNKIKGNGELHNLGFINIREAIKLPLFDITQFLLEDLESLNQKKINSKYFPFFWRYKKSIRIISRPNNT
tara:strand:- start:272 stop:880 length:609 start_codon:yes stop_codon:yes gene_type:complete